ncbi:hypothetical protein [Amycolatopsis sp. NPDC004378]
MLDVAGVRGDWPLTYRAASLVFVLEALLAVAVLAVVIAGTQLPVNLIAFRLTPGQVLIAGLWVAGLFLLRRAGRSLPWQESGQAPDGQDRPRGHKRGHTEQQATAKGTSTTKAASIFAAAALVILVAGVFLERSGDAIADHIGLSGVLFGATVLAAVTSLPEISTGPASVKHGDYQHAVSDIFLPALFPAATLLSGKAVLPQAQNTDIYLTALAALLTLVYAAGFSSAPDGGAPGWVWIRSSS